MSDEPSISGAVLDALAEELKANAQGHENAITSGELADRIVDEHTEANPKTREAVKELMRRRGLPVIGGGNGYYIPTDPTRVQDALDTLDSRIAGIQERKQLLEENWRNWNQRQAVYQEETDGPTVEHVDHTDRDDDAKTDGGDEQLTDEEREFLRNNPVSKAELLARRRGGV